MKAMTRLRSVWAVTLGLALLAGTVAPDHAWASLSTCRTDPTITLSNGHELQLWTDIGISISQVSTVSYVLHIPEDLSVTATQYDQYGYLEQLTVIADQNQNQFQLDTTIQLTSGAGAVTATAWMSWDKGHNTYKASGKTGQTFSVDFKS